LLHKKHSRFLYNQKFLKDNVLKFKGLLKV